MLCVTHNGWHAVCRSVGVRINRKKTEKNCANKLRRNYYDSYSSPIDVDFVLRLPSSVALAATTTTTTVVVVCRQMIFDVQRIHSIMARAGHVCVTV